MTSPGAQVRAPRARSGGEAPSLSASRSARRTRRPSTRRPSSGQPQDREHPSVTALWRSCVAHDVCAQGVLDRRPPRPTSPPLPPTPRRGSSCRRGRDGRPAATAPAGPVLRHSRAKSRRSQRPHAGSRRSSDRRRAPGGAGLVPADPQRSATSRGRVGVTNPCCDDHREHQRSPDGRTRASQRGAGPPRPRCRLRAPEPGARSSGLHRRVWRTSTPRHPAYPGPARHRRPRIFGRSKFREAGRPQRGGPVEEGPGTPSSTAAQSASHVSGSGGTETVLRPERPPPLRPQVGPDLPARHAGGVQLRTRQHALPAARRAARRRRRRAATQVRGADDAARRSCAQHRPRDRSPHLSPPDLWRTAGRLVAGPRPSGRHTLGTHGARFA